MYPADHRYKNGKLRMLYECLPLSHLITTAGGAAISDTKEALSLKPKILHDRMGIVLGSKIDVEEVLEFNKNNPFLEGMDKETDENIQILGNGLISTGV